MAVQLKSKINWNKYLRLIFFIVLIYTFYKLDFPNYFIVLFGVIILFFIFLKGRTYKKVDNFLNKKIPSLSKRKPWIKKIIIMVVFILIYIILKKCIFMILKLIGLDFQQMIIENLNKSIE
jgi:general stress protein CsbA